MKKVLGVLCAGFFTLSSLSGTYSVLASPVEEYTETIEVNAKTADENPDGEVKPLCNLPPEEGLGPLWPPYLPWG